MPGTFEPDARLDAKAMRAEIDKLRRERGHMRSEAGRRKMHAEAEMRRLERAAFVEKDELALRRWLAAWGSATACDSILQACAAAVR